MTDELMPRIGDVIAAKYRLEKVAGEGGMGIVYAAEHLVLKQLVAVKVLLPDAASSEAVVERFAREARSAAKIDSEHVARVLDAGSLENGRPFLVMEFLEGSDLEELREIGASMAVPEVVDFMIQALEGLAHAHAVNIVHRDLKPANLFLATRPDGSRIIKLVDFGISKATRSAPEDKRLTGQHVLGSPVYMSPEQLRNATDIDGRADLWSVGVVAYELLAGKLPFDGDGVGEIFAAILQHEPAPLSECGRNIPTGLSDVIAKCLRRDRSERWGDAGELARALLPFGSEAQAATVERAQQVLLRSKALRVTKTPFETQLVVAAIEAAAQRAISSSKAPPPLHSVPLPPHSVPLPPPIPGIAIDIDIDIEDVQFRPSRFRVITTGIGVLAVLALALFGAARAMNSSAAAELAQTPEMPALEAGPGERATLDGDAAARSTGSALTTTDAPPAPPKVAGKKAPRARSSAPRSTVTRPHFLKSRE